ncbi:MAG: hypothetical protein ABI867_38800 [Kofleriaceae bacterium]
MRIPLAFDPADYDYGPATREVRTILLQWPAIEWFVPAVVAPHYARTTLARHQQLAHAHDADRFPLDLSVEVVAGGWPEFEALCIRVRALTAWDWKLGALKDLVGQHSRAHGWSIRDAVGAPPSGRPGDLFFNVGNTAIWNDLIPTPPDLAWPARFYISYARGDVYECIEWQLAQPGSPLEANPILPLLQLYADGCYPFSFSSQSLTLFRFRAS